jgi:uncharacterized delta-60 repeat protein
MTTVRRTLLPTLATLGGMLALSGLASAAPPTIQTAPGRVVVSLDGGGIVDGENAGGAVDPAVALPDGGAAAIFDTPGGPVDVVELAADGALDPSFGNGGIARPTVNLPSFSAAQITRQADGKLVLVGSETASSSLEFPPVVLVRLNADGSLDQSFGNGGVDVLPIQTSCNCATLGLRPGGGFVVNGATVAQMGPKVGTFQTEITQWTIAGLSADGALDPSFGQAGLVTLAGHAGYGANLAVLPDGDTVALGVQSIDNAHYVSELTRLLPSGAPDPTFNGGTPQTLPSTANPNEWLAYPDGSVVVGLVHAVVRYTTAGIPDTGFGTGGILQTGPSTDLTQGGQLLPAAGDGALLITQTGPEYGQGHYLAQLIGANGQISPAGGSGLGFQIPFGGGSSSVVTSILPRPVPALDQNTFAGSVLQRPDGSYLFLGEVTVSQPTGEGEGNSIADFAAAALTPSFAVESAFGGPATPLRADISVLNQRAATARTRHGIRVTLRISGPSLARVVIRASGGVVAQSLLPVFTAGRSILPIELTSFGAQLLKRHPRSRLTVSLTARDLLANTAVADTEASLH